MKKKKVIIAVCIILIVLVRVFTPYLGKPFVIHINAGDIAGPNINGFCLSNKVKYIGLFHSDDSGIKFIKYCTGLEELSVSDSIVSDRPVDVNDIANPNLKSLQIMGDAVNWSGLNKCTELKELNLSETNLNSFEDISGLKKLEYLRIYNYNIDRAVSLDNLNELENLKELEIACHNDIDCENISQLENLETLYLSTEGKISGLDKLDSVVSLSLNSSVQEIGDELCDMDNLKELHLYNSTKVSLEIQNTLKENGVTIKRGS